MFFTEGETVFYQNMKGVIDFICSSYVVISIESDFTSPRILVYHENYSDIETTRK